MCPATSGDAPHNGRTEELSYYLLHKMNRKAPPHFDKTEEENNHLEYVS
jgi:hypothetical protein